jgi:CBS domain-containing protein
VIEEVTMTATLSGANSVESLLGTVREAMTAEVVVFQADTPADVAVRRLERSQVSGAPVVDQGRVVGVVTLRDLLVPVMAEGPVQTTGPFHRHEHRLRSFHVRELMTGEPLTVRADAPLAEAVLSMDEAGVNRLPVVDVGGRPVGILTRDDVLRALARRIGKLRPAKPLRSLMGPD